MTQILKSQHSYPAQLAAGLTECWESVVHGESYDRPVLPDLAELTQILDVAYFTGMETDEGRHLRFMLCVTPNGQPPSRPEGAEQIECWIFDEPRAFTVSELKRLAAATDVDVSAIWVTFERDSTASLRIQGILSLGRSWTTARYGFSFDYNPLPKSLNIRVVAAGKVEVYQGGYKHGELSGGLMDVGGGLPSSLDLMGIQDLLNEGHHLARNSVLVPSCEPPREWYSFEYLAYCNTILAVVNSILLGGNGGALIIQRPSSNAIQAGLLKLKYPLSSNTNHLNQAFVRAMSARHVHSDFYYDSKGFLKDPPPDDSVALLARLDFEEAQLKLARCCSVLGRLGGTDGAVVMRSDLTVLGFGAEIVLDKASPAAAAFYKPMTGDGSIQQFDSEEKGMRHRSAIRLCAKDPQVAVFVISHDGGISLVWNKDGQVYFQPSVRTTNLNMILA